MISFGTEKFLDTIDELKPMLHAHYDELALNQDKVPLSPQWAKYAEADERGELVFVMCREDGVLIGYFVGFVSPGLHYSTCLTCCMDIFFVSKEHRDKSTGIKLFKHVERELKSRGVQRWFVGSKEHADASKLFERLAFAKVETYYSKWIGE